MMLLLKQARAYGIGMVLATQNPVDLEYKGLSNDDIKRLMAGKKIEPGKAVDGNLGRGAEAPFGTYAGGKNGCRSSAPSVPGY